MTDTLRVMEPAEAVRELRARGYVVIAPDEIDAVNDGLSDATCGCGTYGVEVVHASVVDPREIPRRAPLTRQTWENAMRWYESQVLPTTLPSDYPVFHARKAQAQVHISPGDA